jgi:hypothetical protein
VSATTAWRYVDEVTALLSARSPKLTAVLRKAREDGLHLLVLDGTLIATDRVRSKRHFSGKHKIFGVDIQVITGPDGTVLWTSGGLPGSTHDLTAARIWGILRELDKTGIITLADKAYQGAGAEVLITPYKGKGKPAPQKQANRSHAKLRGPGERAHAQLKQWRILRKLRCSPGKAGHLVKAIAVLQNHKITQG